MDCHLYLVTMAELSDADGNVIARSYSEKYLPGAGDVDLMNNQNQNWSNTVSFKLSYLFGVLMVWFFLHVTQVFTPEDCWTTTNMIHFVVRDYPSNIVDDPN